MSEAPDWFSYDHVTDVVTIDGFRFSRALLSQFTTSPIGVRFRVLSRKDGVVTVTTERDPLEAAAPEMLAAARHLLDCALAWHDSHGTTPDEWSAIKKTQAAIAKAEAAS